jgi:hypothetical protein
LPALIQTDTFRSQIIENHAINEFFNSHSELKRHILINLFSKDRENATLIYGLPLVSGFLPLMHFALNKTTKPHEKVAPRLFDLGTFYGKLLVKLPAHDQIKLRCAIFEVLGYSLPIVSTCISKEEQKSYNQIGSKLDDLSVVISLVRALEADQLNSSWADTLTKSYSHLVVNLAKRDFSYSAHRISRFN